MSFFHARTLSFSGFAFLLSLLLLVTGCSRSTVSTRFKAPEFALADLRTSPSLLVVSPEVRVNAFKKSYRSVFPDTASLSTRLTRKILDSLKLEKPLASPPKYVIYVRTVTIGDSLTQLPSGILPGVTGGMEPAGGGTSTSCLVTLDMEILDPAGTSRYAFTVRTQADVLLYAYKTALLTALDAAAHKAAAHLRGF